MFVIHLEHAPDSIRGELSLFSQEIAPFTFVSNASAKTRNKLWEDIINIDGISAVLIYTDKNEQQYSVKKIGYPSYEFENFDGLQLIVKPENALTKMIAEKLWAKLNPKKSLIDHMLETGIVAGCLMNGIFKPLVNRLVELTEINEGILKSQIIFICAMHDIGKAHPVFQGRDVETNEMLRGYELNQETVSTMFRHEEYAEKMIKQTDLFGLDADTRSKLMIRQIISLHHQKEKEREEKDFVEIKSKISERWGNIQKYIYNYIKEIFPCEKIEFPDAVFKNQKTKFAVENGILGILITSDWIASNNEAMDNKTIKDFSDVGQYLDWKQKVVTAFLFGENLTRSTFPDARSFDSLFHFGNGRPVQRDVVDIVQKNNIKLMLIESGCGSGKTEAALYAASVLGNKNELSGIYMGLPTGTSAEAIQGRVDDFLSELHMRKTKLYTSKSMLLRENNTEPSWTDVSRQRLLTPSAVGTVDQVMTAARLVRFESVRMAGLSSKVLIIDEIHAYDAYMITVIERLLQICNVLLGIPVILLSATLPVSTKRKLFSTIIDESDIDMHSGYPLISYVTTDNEFYECQSESYEPDKNIECESLPILNDYESIAEMAVKNVECGGCECVIMNTVSDAINVYDSIKKIADDNYNVILYHARMPEKTKDEKIKKILKWCGKNRSERPERAIIVGTQVLEQSIDIDVDYMITAICPVDLLLQRIGRYHRHGDEGTIRERMDVKNVVQVLVPDADDDAEYGGTGHVYKPCYLDATRQVIVERHVLQIPSCTPEIINRVYESADIKTVTEDRIKNAKSDAGNINIENGFELYEKCVLGKLSDRYINVRESGEPTVQIAILDEDEMQAAKKKRNNNQENNSEVDAIELFKRNVVTVPLHYLNDFDGGEYGTGIFRDVKIFSLNDVVNPDGDKKICVDGEYGFRVLDV